MRRTCRTGQDYVIKMVQSKWHLVFFIVWCLFLEGVLAASKCKDVKKFKSRCQEWVDAGECVSSAEFMLENCPTKCETASCKCPGMALTGFDADKKCNCVTWAIAGQMLATDAKMKKDCPSIFQLATTVNCGQPPSVTNTQAQFTRTFYLSSVKYYCVTGYEKTSGMTGERWCHKDGAWKMASHHTDPVCAELKCSKPEDKTGFTWKVSDSSYKYGTVATYTCSGGNTGEGTLKCGQDKKWAGTLPTCKKVTCGVPNNIENGQWTYGKDQKDNFNDTVTYSCKTGYSLAKGKASESITCQMDGKWTSTPSCVYGNTGPGKKPVPMIGDSDAAVVFAAMFPFIFLLVAVVIVLSIIIHKCRIKEKNRNKQLNTVYDI